MEERPDDKVCRNRRRSTDQYSKFFAKLSPKESGVPRRTILFVFLYIFCIKIVIIYDEKY